MDFIKLTKRETEIMAILWGHDNISANDIMQVSEELSINTIQQTLQKLLRLGFIEVSGIGKNKKAIARLYSPIISETDYIESFIGEDIHMQLTASFIKKTKDLELIKQLTNLLQARQKELIN